MTRLPPALVPRLPPIRHEPRAPRSSGTKKPASSAARWITSSGVPARTVMVADAGSISSIPEKRSNEIATAPVNGCAPPVSPVSPACGTTGTPCSAQIAMASAKPCGSFGRTTASGWVGGRKLLSWVLRAGISAPSSHAGPSKRRASAALQASISGNACDPPMGSILSAIGPPRPWGGRGWSVSVQCATGAGLPACGLFRKRLHRLSF